MNFHKTIGYLAALLLMVGIGVPDSFAQAPKIVISASTTSLSDDTDVTVTVTLTLTGGEGTNSEVTLTQTNSDNTPPASGFSSDDFTRTTTPSIAVADGAGEADHEITFDFTDATAALAQGDGDAVDDKVTLVATWDHDGDSATDAITSNTVTINIKDTAANLAEDAVDASGFRVFLTSPGNGKWTGVGKHKVKVQVQRLDGPASQWGNYNSIRVDLYNNSTAMGHNDKGVRTDGTPPIYSLSVGDAIQETVDGATVDRHQLSDLVFSTMKTDTLVSMASNNAPDGTGTAVLDPTGGKASQVAYKRRTRSGRYDILEFRMSIPESEGVDDITKVYAVAQFNVNATATALAVGTAGDDRYQIESRDTETSIYEGGGFSDVVGDGNLIKIDRDAPAVNIVQALNVMIGKKGKNKEAAGSTVYAGIGKTIVSTASISGVFRESKVVVQIIAPDSLTKGTEPDPNDPTNATRPKEVIPNDQALSGYKNEVTAQNIFATGNTLKDSVEVAEGSLRRKYTISDPTDDDAFKKNDTIPANDLDVQVRVQVVDKANNATTQTDLSPIFKLDCKRPEVTILYPKPSAADSATFTARVTQKYTFLGDGEETQNLKPLNFEVDEKVSKAFIILGVPDKPDKANPQPDTLEVAAFDGDALDDEDDNTVDGYDLTADNLKHINPTKIPHDVKAGNRTNNKPHQDSAQGGGLVDLTVVAFDLAGNTGSATPDGGQPTFDAKNPAINENKFFPRADALEDNKIGGPEGTQNPVFRVNEKVDSVLVRYDGPDGILEVGLGGTAATSYAANQNIKVKFMGDQELQEGESYDLQVYVRDLAGHVDLSNMQEGLTYEAGLMNPQAGGFKIYTHVRNNKLAKGSQGDAHYGLTDGKIATGQMDSIVAGQALRLTLVAVDAENDKLTAITYSPVGAKIVAMDSDGNMIPSAKFWGVKGSKIKDNGDGSATLAEDDWTIGETIVFMNIKTEMNGVTVAVKDVTPDGVVNFMSTKEGITVDAADFRKFSITPQVDGEKVSEVWGDFEIEVVPTDAFGNPSLKTFSDGTPKTAGADSSDILDTRINKAFLGRSKTNTRKYGSLDVRLSSALINYLPSDWSISAAGQTFSVTALERDGGEALVRVSVDNSFLNTSPVDSRSRNLSDKLTIPVVEPTDVSITLWGPNGENWTEESDLTLPAGGGTVTFRAEGFSEGDMVTFTKNGEDAGTEEADADGQAGLPVELTGSGTVTVKAALGTSSAEVSYNYEEQTGRREFVDANGDPVYLISSENMTVDVGDFLAFRAALGTSSGDTDYNPQADVNDDGTVDIADFLIFITSYGKTATGPATKPLVLAPGVNQNAEFSLSLGSERVLAGEMVAVDVSLANVEALMGYGFTLNYDATKFEFISVAPADEDLLKSTGGETPIFHHVPGNGQVEVVNGVVNGTAVSGGGDIVRFVFRVLYEFEDNARFEIADGLVFDPSNLSNPAVVAGVLELQSTPREFALHQNFPNPFNPDTTIKYDLAESADVTLQIYNVLGQVVRTLVASEAQSAGRYQIRWNGMDERGVPVSSGIYFYQIAADGKFSDVRKLMLLK